MRYLPANAQHIGSRAYQQDSFGFADPRDDVFLSHGGFLAVLCDGMGGMQHGDVASQTAVRALLEAYSQKTPEENIPAALERSVRSANRQVVQAALNLGLTEGVGTTLVAAVLHETSLYYISVGDSAVFHVRDGQAQLVNRHHVFANLLDQAADNGQISRREAEQHPEREALTSYIGLRTLREIDRNLEPWHVGEGETILLASDGMFKTLDLAEMAGFLQGHPQSWPRALVRGTLARRIPHQDNVTVVSVTLDSGTLGEWHPPAENDAFDLPPARADQGAVRRRLNARWWLALGFVLLLVVAGLAGWWYSSSS
jgi:serine/threonine protein phosphatase PrpC